MHAPTGLIDVLLFVCRGGYYPPFIYKISLRFARDAKDVVPYNVWLFSSFHICYAKIPPSRVVFSFYSKNSVSPGAMEYSFLLSVKNTSVDVGLCTLVISAENTSASYALVYS